MPKRNDPTGRFDAIHAGHAHIHQHHIGVQRLRQGDRLRAIAGLPDDGHIGLRADHHREPGAQQFLIIGDDHSDIPLLTHTPTLSTSIRRQRWKRPYTTLTYP